jgi:hypothetical protein
MNEAAPRPTPSIGGFSSGLWESAWDMLNETLRRVASSLSSDFPAMTWSAGHNDNKAFPFRAYATFNGGEPESADVVVSVDVHRSPDDELQFNTYIGLDDGTVLAEGPTSSINVVNGLLASREEIDSAVTETSCFIERSVPLLRKTIKLGQP